MRFKTAFAATRRVRFWSDARLLNRKSNLVHWRTGTLTALAALAGTAMLADRVQGATFTYNPTNNGTGPDNWSTSANFSPTPPVSGTTTALTFVGANTTQLASGLTNTSTNNLGDFVLNSLSLQGTDPATGGTAATININSATGSFLDFQSNGTTTPVVNLNALSSGAGLIYNVNSNAALTNNTTFQGSGTATFNFNGVLSGTGSLTMAATGAMTLGGANTYSGGTIASAGTLDLGSTAALGTGALTLNGGFVAPTTTATSTNVATTATGGIVFSSGAYTFAGTPAISANLNLTGASGDNIIKSVGSGNPVISGNLNLGGVARTFALADTGGDAAPELTVSGVISNGSVVMDNTLNGTSTQEYGSLLFSGTNAYAGGTTINVGRLEITNVSALGTGNVTVGTRGTLAFGGSGQSYAGGGTAFANNLSLGHTVSGSYGQDAVQENSGEADLTGTVTMTGATQFNVGGTLVVNANNVAADVITGNFALTKVGGGTMVLLGAQTYTGGTTVTGGVLQLGIGSTFVGLGTSANGSVTGTINQTGGGILIDNATAQTFSNTVTGTGNLQIAGLAPVTLSGNQALGSLLLNTTTVTLSSNSVITGTRFASLGVNAFEFATLSLPGSASLAVTSDFNVGDNTGSNGILNIGTSTSDNPTLSATTLYVGKGNNTGGSNVTTGVVNQIAGTVNLTGGTESRIGGGVGLLDVNSVGIYRFSGGTINGGNANFQVGAYGQGEFLQTGTGTTFSDGGGYPDVGRFATGYGVVDVSAGAFNQTGTGFRMIVGEQGTGIMTVRGTGTASFTGGLSIGLNAGTGIFNLDAGGTVTTLFVGPAGSAGTANTVAGSNSTFNFNGGTLKNSGTAPNFFTNLTTANVYSGGAIFDTTAGNATVGQSLVAPAGGGVSSVTITGGGASYVAPPIVQITGGSGKGATGIATINANGQVTGVTITNPGTGYVAGDNVTFNFEAAGFDSSGAVGNGATATANITANVSGGLTKLGANSLTLSGTNTYTGATTVSAGTLVSGSAGAIPASTALVNNATVNLNSQYGKASGSTTPGLTLSGLTAGASSTTTFGLNTTTADYIAVTNAASVASGAKISLGIATGATGLTPGTYNLFTDTAGGLANFTLSTTSATVNGQAYTFSLNATSTSDILTIAVGQTAKLYYTGNTSNSLSVVSNYTTDAAGTTTSTITPSGITDVVFTANVGTAANFTTTLGSVTAVNSLEFTGTGTPAATTPVTVGGPGTFTINAGANTFAAGTGIVIDAGAAADTISANMTLATSESFINNSTSRFTVSGAIGSTNTGTVLTMNDAGGGGFLLSGANTYTGSTVIAAGTTSLGSSTALGNAGNTVALNAGTLNINGQTVMQSSITMAGGVLADTATTPGSLVLTTAGTAGAALNITGTYAPTAYARTAGISLTGATNFIAKSTGSGQSITTGAVNLNSGATTIALADSPGDAAPELALEGVVSGTGSLTLNNAATIPGVTLANTADYGTLYMSGTNTYSGGTNIVHGRIVVTNGSALGTGPVTLTQIAAGGGGTLQFGNNAYATNSSPLAVGVITGVTLPNAVTLGGALSGNYGEGLFNDSGANTMSGPMTLANTNQTIFVNTGSLTISGVISQSSGVTANLTQTGTATLALTNAANSYTGVTTSTGGTLSVSTLANGGINSSIGASSNAASNLVLGGNTTLLYTGAGAVTDRGFTVTSGGLTIDNANALTFGGQVVQASGSNSSFTKADTGTLSFTNTTGTNTFLGGTTGNGLGFVVNGGILALGGTATAPLAQTNQISGQLIVGSINTATSPSAEMDINGGTTTITNYIGVGRGNGTNNAATTLTLNNNAIVTSPNFSIGYNNGVAGFTSSPTVNFNGTSQYTDSGAFTVGESVNGTGGVSTVNLNGTATINLTSTGTMPLIGLNGAAVFNQNGGTVTTADSIRLAANGSSTATYNLNGGMLTTATIQQGGGAGNFVFNGGTLQASASDNPAATSNPTTFITGVTTTVGNGGAIINTNSCNVTDASVLMPASGSTGGLTKNGTGILTMSAANTYVGTTTINAGTLAISINGGLAAGNVSVAAGATLNLATGVTAAHNATMGTTLTLASAATSLVSLSGTGVQDTVAKLVVNGVMEPFGTYGATGSGATFTNITDFTGTGELLVAAVPEPSTWATIIGGMGLFAYARRRQVRDWLRLPRLF